MNFHSLWEFPRLGKGDLAMDYFMQCSMDFGEGRHNAERHLAHMLSA